jgi:hypothetical protein
MIVGVPDVTSIGAVNMGFLYIDYLVDFYQPTIDQGFTLHLTEEENRLILERRAKQPQPTNDIGELLRRISKCEQILQDEEEEEQMLASREPTPLRGRISLR